MSLIERYIMAEVRQPFVAVTGILVFIFASYTAGRYLNEAAAGTIGLDVVLRITWYRALIALEVLIPVALYVSVVMGLGRLYSDHEMSAAAAVGVGPARVYRAVAALALPVAVGVAVISIYGRPWAYTNAYSLKARAESDLNMTRLQADRFNVNEDTGRMLLAERIDRDTGRFYAITIYTRGATTSSLIRAEEAWWSDPDPTAPVLELREGSAYSLQREGPRDRTLRFARMTLHLDPFEQELDYRRKAAPSTALAASAALTDRAELQWRLSRGPVALLLALLAVPLSHSAPRRGRFANLLPVTVVYAAIYYGSGFVKVLVGNGAVPAVPGLWSVPAAMALAVALLARRRMRRA